MVTRNIVKNTPTQVNSHLIGVRKLPDVTNVEFKIYPKIVATVNGDVYYINNSPLPYWWRPRVIEYEGERYCKVQYAVGVGEKPGEEFYYYKDTSDGSNPALYSKPEVGTQMYVMKGQSPNFTMEAAGVVCTGTAKLTLHTFVASGPESGGYLPLNEGYQLNMATGEIDFNGEILYAKGVGSSTGYREVGSFDRVEGNKYFYNVAEEYPLPSMSFYTEGRPEVGSEVHTDDIYITKPSYVSGITEGAISDCVVSYSVDGKVFTDVDTVLTDDNNVIANIPRYMYLKFSQDVAITEE